MFGTITVTNTTGPGFITAYGCADGLAQSSNVNYIAGQTVADLAALHTDANGDICFFADTATDLIWDQAAETTAVTSHKATRLLDTRLPA